MEKKQHWPFLLVIPLIAAAAVAGWFMLPDELIVQIGVDGQPSSIMAKPFGLMIPVALGVLGSGLASSEAKGKVPASFASQRLAGFVTLAAAAIVTIIIFAWNL